MIIDISSEKTEVNELYKQLKEAAIESVTGMTAPLDGMIKQLESGVSTMSNSELWDMQMRLGVETYKLGIAKEQSSLKSTCSDAFYKLSLAQSFCSIDGAQETKKQKSIADNVKSQAVAMLYSTASSILKTKMDEAHRIVNIIQSILISRASDAKNSGNPRSEQDIMSSL